LADDGGRPDGWLRREFQAKDPPPSAASFVLPQDREPAGASRPWHPLARGPGLRPWPRPWSAPGS